MDEIVDFPVSGSNWEPKASAERLKNAVQKAGGYNKIVELAGVSPTTLNNYLNGREMKLSTAQRIANACGVPLQWLIFGMSGQSPHDIAGNEDQDFIRVTRFDVAFSAGNGCISQEFTDKGHMEFYAPLFPQEIRSKISKCLCVRVNGDSMSPSIYDGDYVLIDPESPEIIKDGHVYAARIDNTLVIKRLFISPHGKLIISSDNKNYPSSEFPIKELKEIHDNSGISFKIFGKVIWRLGEVRGI